MIFLFAVYNIRKQPYNTKSWFHFIRVVIYRGASLLERKTNRENAARQKSNQNSNLLDSPFSPLPFREIDLRRESAWDRSNIDHLFYFIYLASILCDGGVGGGIYYTHYQFRYIHLSIFCRPSPPLPLRV